VRHSSSLDTLAHLQKVGRVPLPHYIRDGVMMPEDRDRYQTVYGTQPGSVAAPTAGLHFTTELLTRLHQHGIGHIRVTLHVGLGTFRPIAAEHIEDHTMHAEWGMISTEAADQLNQSRQYGGRLVAVGTTSCRLLETASRETGIGSWSGTTELFIHPPFNFRATDALLTNFHLPRSSLLVLVRTFGGDDLMRRAYDAAIRQQYRFFSYGDAMLIL
jgi:S-adenosylmethionine:tRNA ribosyltransferase-isomerase